MAEGPTITGHTKAVALIGTPVEHSMSPAMHTASFAEMGLDYIYVAFDIQPEELQVAAEGLKTLGFVGYNVTMPHKTMIHPFLDGVSEAAEIMGAVNTVFIKDGKAIGYNTDGAGFMRNVKENDVDIIGKKITVAGAGGAGSAVFTQAALDGVDTVDVFNIKDDFYRATEKRVAAIAERTGCRLTLHDLDDKKDLQNSVADSTLFLNATRVGMAPLEDQCVLPEEFLRPDLVVADTVYNPKMTTLLTMADAKGCKVLPGLGMLLYQAAIGEEIWTEGKHMNIDFIEKKFYS